MKPWLSEFSGTWTRDLKIRISGIQKVYILNEKKGEVHITRIPPSWEFEKYEIYLRFLLKRKSIKDYDNNSSSGVDYLLKFKKDDLQELIAKDKLEAILKIVDSDTENLTTLDENEKLKIFDCVEDIVKYFVDFRLVFYQKRKDYFQVIDKLSKLRVLAFKAKFIKSIIDKKLVVNNVKKEVIIKWLDENNL